MTTTKKHFSNIQVSDLLRSVAVALVLDDEIANRFRIIAFQKAADAIEHLSVEIKYLWKIGELNTVSGIGQGIAGYIDELFSKGFVTSFDKIIKKYPKSVYELVRVSGIGPKNAYKLSKALGLSKAENSTQKLFKAAKKGQVALIDGFGEDSQSALIKNLSDYFNRSQRMLITQAEAISSQVIDYLSKIPQVSQVVPLGSLRRGLETIGDIDLAVASNHPKIVIDHFIRYPYSTRVIESGDNSASIVLVGNHQVDIKVQPEVSFGSLLQHFTGSKQHNIALRELSQSKHMSLSEYGIKLLNKPSHLKVRGENKGGYNQNGVSYDKGGHLITFSTEEALYNFLGLDFIPPELRENTGEIELAQKHLLPQLINQSDITGDLHVHSDFDIQTAHDLGQSSISQYVHTAKQLNYQYLGFNDHNPAVTTHTQNQTLELIKVKTNIVHKYNENQSENNFYIFNGLEVDIQSDGSRAVSDKALELLDYASVSIHSSFRQNRKVMTKRIINGLDHPKVRFFSHPTSRIINQRTGIDIDWDLLFDFCQKNDKWLEINSWPNRLDLSYDLIKSAIGAGIKLVINTDSHNSESLKFIKYGVTMAKKGWSTSKNVINTLSLPHMKHLLRLKGGE